MKLEWGLVALAVLVLLLLTLGLAQAAHAWTSLGAMPPPERRGDDLVFTNPRGSVVVSALAADVVRIRFEPGAATDDRGAEASFAVVSRELGSPAVEIETGGGRSVMATGALVVTLEHSPFRVRIADSAGRVLDEDVRGMALGVPRDGDVRVAAWKRLLDDEHVYGLGEKTGPLDKRGNKLGGTSYAMWNLDTFGFDDATDPLYASVPFYLVLRQGRAHGIFLDNTYRSHFDIGRAEAGVLHFGAAGGALDYYFFAGPTPKKVIERYTELTGRPPLPPLWSLGYHQCRYSYFPDERVRFIAANFRQRKIPADALWLDIDYQDAFKPFTWNAERFPDPGRLIADLRLQGFRTVTIVDPHPKREEGYFVYDSGSAGGHFVTRPDGSLFTAPVWPARAEEDPGPSVFPDFSRAATRRWWGDLYRDFVALGIAGIWNDMNEPAIFDVPSGTFPLDVRHRVEDENGAGRTTDHREIHNVYGMLMTRSTYQGLRRLRPGERPFVLTRATFAGGQRYAAVWPGDNASEWDDLRSSFRMLLGMGVSGLGFSGGDVGGFLGAPSPELYTRWLQAAIFFPFLRTHTASGSPEQDPWSYGTRHEAANRRAIELRYRLLPHLYDAMRQMSLDGVPVARPLFVEYPAESRVRGLDHQLLLGADLLAAPVLTEGAEQRWLFLPAGAWYGFASGERLVGDAWRPVEVDLDSIPLFVREGAFVFTQEVVQHTGEMPGRPLEVSVYPSATAPPRGPESATRTFYEDDGESFDYLDGGYLERDFSWSRTAEGVAVTVGAARGDYRPRARDLVLRVRLEAAPRRVELGGEVLEAEAWEWDRRGYAVLRFDDRWEGVRVVLER